MNKIYKIKFNEYGYDEYDSFIVIASSEEEVVAFILKEHPKTQDGYSSSINWTEGYKIEEVNLEEKGIVLSSYNAG